MDSETSKQVRQFTREWIRTIKKEMRSMDRIIRKNRVMAGKIKNELKKQYKTYRFDGYNASLQEDMSEMARSIHDVNQYIAKRVQSKLALRDMIAEIQQNIQCNATIVDEKEKIKCIHLVRGYIKSHCNTIQITMPFELIPVISSYCSVYLFQKRSETIRAIINRLTGTAELQKTMRRMQHQMVITGLIDETIDEPYNDISVEENGCDDEIILKIICEVTGLTEWPPDLSTIQ
eukprot:456515_1